MQRESQFVSFVPLFAAYTTTKSTATTALSKISAICKNNNFDICARVKHVTTFTAEVHFSYQAHVHFYNLVYGNNWGRRTTALRPQITKAVEGLHSRPQKTSVNGRESRNWTSLTDNVLWANYEDYFGRREGPQQMTLKCLNIFLDSS